MSHTTRLLPWPVFVALVAMFVLAYVNRGAAQNGYYNRGNVWQHKKEYDKAIADYNEAIRLDPTMPLPTSAGATPGVRRRSTTRRSPTSTKPSGSIHGLHRLPDPG